MQTPASFARLDFRSPPQPEDSTRRFAAASICALNLSLPSTHALFVHSRMSAIKIDVTNIFPAQRLHHLLHPSAQEGVTSKCT